jgi:alkylation response protein AidB-like acyl-CoA dehydrogenase
MNFDYTQEQQEFRQELRDWYRENLPEGWIDGDRDLPDDEDEREEFLEDWQRRLHESGLAAIHWPEEHGGRDASMMEQLIFHQVKAWADPPSEINEMGVDLVGPAILEYGTEEQKERFLPPMLSGEERWCIGYSEPNTGSDLASLQCEAVEEDNKFRINGQKIWTTNAHKADWCYLFTRTDESGPKHHGITALIVDMAQDGVTTERIRQITEERDFNQVYFDDATAPKENVLNEVDQGAMKQLTNERVVLSQAFDLEHRFDALVERCRSETRNGEPLSEDPNIRQKLAELDTRIQAAKLTYLRNVSRQMNGEDVGAETSFGKLYDSELAADLEHFRMEVLGPGSVLWGDDSRAEAAKDLLTTFSYRIGGGTSDIQRNIIGERVLGLPKGDQ